MHGTNWHLYILYSPLSLNRDSGNVKYERYSTLDNYAIFKFGGTSLRDDERGLRTMLQYFPDFFT